MNKLVPVELYAYGYHYILLFLVILTALHLYARPIDDELNKKYNFIVLPLLFFLIFLYMGTRPVSFWFGDMGVYAANYDDFRRGELPKLDGDILFYGFMKFCSTIMEKEFFFLIIAFFYTYPIYLISKKWGKENALYLFLMLIGAFSFWAYGTNGLRNGLATSIFLFAISKKSLKYQLLWMIFAILIHKSTILIVVFYLIAFKFNDTKKIIYLWFISILLSLAVGSVLENFLLSIGVMGDDKITAYLNNIDQYANEFSKTGFRLDFLIYSATGVLAGWYYKIKKGFNNQFYNIVYAFYVIANSFWVIVIRAAYSNRFAYLSWFILSVIIFYPLVHESMIKNEKNKLLLANIMILYFAFTFLMNVILN
ncbi:EpsG family protein [Flavobacterium sp. J27]|uniref:EpsG family protein n=1 Tax=Flavobacterium sp. J27 TaxID=2060419 RepID=UPI00102FD0B6|nr:EpsG family protein [Flavobacterium sp. J27]